MIQHLYFLLLLKDCSAAAAAGSHFKVISLHSYMCDHIYSNMCLHFSAGV